MALVQNFANDPEAREESRTSGGEFAYYYGPIRALNSCMVCHQVKAANRITIRTPGATVSGIVCEPCGKAAMGQ